MISISRSGLEAHQDCPRKYYLTYLDGGRGWASPVDSAVQLQQGTHLHLGMEALMRAVKEGVEGAELIGLQTLRETPHSLERDDYLIVEALYLAWVRTRLEEFLSEYEIVSVEEPMTVPLREIEIYVKGDVVVRSRHSGLCWSVDWKTTSSPSNWATRWKREPQGFLQTWATREKYPEVAGTIFEGLVKGKKYQGKYTSPLVRGWVGLAEDGEAEDGGGSPREKVRIGRERAGLRGVGEEDPLVGAAHVVNDGERQLGRGGRLAVTTADDNPVAVDRRHGDQRQ